MTRRRARQQEKSKIDSFTLKISELPSNKKAIFKKYISKWNKTAKERKEIKRKRVARNKSQKKKYGKYHRTFLDLERALNPKTADYIISLAKNLEKKENKMARDLKKTHIEKDRLEKRLLKLDETISSYENSIKNYSSPSWRKNNVSPELLEHLQVVGVFYHIHSLREECNRLRQKKVKLKKQLEDLNKKLKSFTK